MFFDFISILISGFIALICLRLWEYTVILLLIEDHRCIFLTEYSILSQKCPSRKLEHKPSPIPVYHHMAIPLAWILICISLCWRWTSLVCTQISSVMWYAFRCLWRQYETRFRWIGDCLQSRLTPPRTSCIGFHDPDRPECNSPSLWKSLKSLCLSSFSPISL